MTQAIKKYAIDLKNTGISKEMLQQVKEILEAVPQIQADFENPTVEIAKKHLVIERVFPTEVRNFIKILCMYKLIYLSLLLTNSSYLIRFVMNFLIWRRIRRRKMIMLS